jgi:mono/diheme cytochrome c family protein
MTTQTAGTKDRCQLTAEAPLKNPVRIGTRPNARHRVLDRDHGQPPRPPDIHSRIAWKSATMRIDLNHGASMPSLCRVGSIGVLALVWATGAWAAGEAGKLLLEEHCGRCHALAADMPSPLAKAPNLWTALRSYPTERLEFELAEGIGSRHRDMPQIQFTSDEIQSIEAYLLGE